MKLKRDLIPERLRQRVHVEAGRHKINYVTELCPACGAIAHSPDIEGEIQRHMVDVAIDATATLVQAERKKIGRLAP